MKVAYLITAHAHPTHFIRLVRKLDSADSVFIIHIDKKARIAPFREVEKWVDTKKIVWMKRCSLVWAGFNLVRVPLQGMRLAAHLPFPVDYVCVISGQHYPVRPVAAFHAHLKNNEGKSFIEYAPMPRPNWANGGLDRIHYYHFIFRHFRIALPLISYLKVKLRYVDKKRFRLTRKIVRWLPAAPPFPRKFVDGCSPFEGSNWFTLHMGLVLDILQQVEKDPSLYRFFRRAHCADEMFFQTLILNRLPHRCNELVNSNLTYICWDESTGRPYTLDEGFLHRIDESKAFLARKFDPESSASLLDHLDRRIKQTQMHS